MSFTVKLRYMQMGIMSQSSEYVNSYLCKKLYIQVEQLSLKGTSQEAFEKSQRSGKETKRNAC